MPRYARRQLVTDVELAQLQVGSVLDVHLGLRVQRVGPCGNPGVPGRLLIHGVPGRIVQQLRQVDDVPAVLPLPREAEAEAFVRQVTRQPRPEVRVGVADMALGADDLRRRLSLLDAEGAERRAEPPGVERRDGKMVDASATDAALSA